MSNENGVILDDITNKFPQKARDTFIRDFRSRHLLVLNTLMPYLTTNTGTKNILDIGTGHGIIPLVLRHKGHNLNAVDIWKEWPPTETLSGTKESLLDRLHAYGIATHECNIDREALPFEDNSFDIVTFLHVIEHLRSSPRRALCEIHRVLRPGGILLLEGHNAAALKNRAKTLTGKSIYASLDMWFNDDYFFDHIREYTLSELKTMLNWSDFRVEKAILSNCLHTPLIRLFKHNPVKLAAFLIYLYMTAIVPGLRYEAVLVGRALGKAPE